MVVHRFIVKYVYCLALMTAMFLQSGCSIQKQRFSSGFHVEFLENRANHHATSISLKKTVTSYALKRKSAFPDSGKTGVVIPTEDELLQRAIDSLPEMNFPHDMLMRGKGASKKLGPASLNGIKNRRIVTIHSLGKSFCGRLVGVNTNGVFIVNHFRELVGFDKTEYGKSQDFIYRQVYFVPFKEIDAIHLGGTLFYKVEKMVEPVFQYLAILLVLAGAAMSVLLWAWTGASSGSGSEVVLGFLVIVGTVLAAIFAGLFAIALVLIVAPFQFIGSRLPGRYWKIGKSAGKGQRFIADLIRGKSRYRVF